MTPCEQAGTHLPGTGHSQTDCPTVCAEGSAASGTGAGTYRIRWTLTVDLIVTVTADDEEAAYDMAVDLAKERLEQVAVTNNHVAIHGDIDGMGADEVECPTTPGQGTT